jgi:NAD-dependent dihydropyrimidine dehydrogenase PreA subunit
MSIQRIDPELCVGCGTCVISCPADVIKMNWETGKAFVKYPQDCAACCWCLGECPQKAVVFSPVKMSPPFASWG